MLVLSKNHSIIFIRAVTASDNKPDKNHEEIKSRVKKCKEMLDKDCIFFWRLFQDIFKKDSINFTGILVLPNISNSTSDALFCR